MQYHSAQPPLWLYNMTNTKQSLCLLFSAPLQTFCGAVVLHAQRAAYCVPFRFACAGNSCPAWFILSAFTAFATSGHALVGLSLLSILGRRSWIVSLAPSYMLFFCVSIFQRTSFFVVGSGATRKNFPRLGHNVLNKMASSRIFKALTDNCALSIVLSTSKRAFRPCKPACLRRFAGNSIK